MKYQINFLLDGLDCNDDANKALDKLYSVIDTAVETHTHWRTRVKYTQELK